MFSELLGLILNNTKVVLGIVLLLVVIVVGGIIKYQWDTIETLKTDIRICNIQREYDKAIYEEERLKAKKAIESQNEAISNLEKDKENYESKVREEEKRLLDINLLREKEINEALEKDSSSDNQLNIMKNLLREFSNETP